MRPALIFALSLTSVAATSCIDKEQAQKAIELVAGEGARPDSMPRMLNAELPFRIPQALYERGVQGNVTLRIFIDTAGLVVPESTSVDQSSGHPSLDSAAVKGSEELRFAPATLHGRPVGLSLKLPVYFRHPDAPPLPGDTILKPPTPQSKSP
ncbi:MAG TPA: energy transducer TonB [Gemmatimonadaceae bacterium]|nr:energy transducer TonB [Gemmatimonadaceae bacterium]